MIKRKKISVKKGSKHITECFSTAKYSLDDCFFLKKKILRNPA